MSDRCLTCGQPLYGQLPSHYAVEPVSPSDAPGSLHPSVSTAFQHYCSLPCATLQLQTLGMLLHSTPRPALSLAEWHDLSQSYASDLERLDQAAA